MTDCIKVEQAAGCVTRANGETENILIVREFGTGADGKIVLARTHLTDINGAHIALADGDFARIGACLACCGDVTISDLNPPGNKIATITLANGQTVELNETITEFTSLFDATTGIKLGEYVNEAGDIIEVFAPKQSIDVNLTPITYVPTATGNTENLGQVVIDPTGKIWIIDTQGDAQALTMPTFKELNRWYVDPNGSNTTGTGANENPYLTVAAAYAQAGQGDTVVVNEGVYAETVTLSTQNTTLAGASGAYGSLTQIAGVNATASGTSVRVADLTVTGAMTHTGTAPLYLNNVTVSGAFTATSAVYREIRDSSLQDNPITVTAGTTLIEDSKVGTASFTGAGTVVALRNVTVDPGECITIGAGVIYSVADVTGCVNIDPAAIPATDAALAAGLPAALAEALATTSFNNLRVTDMDFEASPTKVVTYNEVTGELEYSDFPVAMPTTTSITPVVYDGTGYVPAQADAEENLADLIELSDGTRLHDGKLVWENHGLEVGQWYYLSQDAAGGYTVGHEPTGWAQQLFFVEDANTIHVDIEEGWNYSGDGGTAPAEFAQTVYVNSTSPTTATIFDLANPPATNDDTLKADSSNIYIGTDGSTWTYNSATGTYNTYVYPVTAKHGVLAYAPSQTVPNNAVTNLVNYNTATNTSGTAWNPATGVFTAARAGWYDVSMNLFFNSGTWNGGSNAQAIITKNGQYVASNYVFVYNTITGLMNSVTTSTKVYLNVGDTIRPQAYQASGAAKTTSGAIYNSFSITEIG